MDKKDIKFSKHLFWDIDVEKLDIDKYPGYVLQRVLEYGKWEDWVQIRAYYPMELIRKEAMRLRTLSPESLSYIALYTDTNREDYRCYKFAQLHPTPWNSYIDETNKVDVQHIPYPHRFIQYDSQ